MSRNLGSQNRAIPSPWADYEVFSFPDASHVGEAGRQALMDAMNDIIAVNWKATEPHWTAASSPFDSKYSLILVYDRSDLVAFSVYRILKVADRLAIYRSGTEVLPTHQGRGLYGFFTSEILKRSGASDPDKAGILYGWRTRNPIVWAANAAASTATSNITGRPITARHRWLMRPCRGSFRTRRTRCFRSASRGYDADVRTTGHARLALPSR